MVGGRSLHQLPLIYATDTHARVNRTEAYGRLPFGFCRALVSPVREYTVYFYAHRSLTMVREAYAEVRFPVAAKNKVARRRVPRRYHRYYYHGSRGFTRSLKTRLLLQSQNISMTNHLICTNVRGTGSFLHTSVSYYTVISCTRVIDVFVPVTVCQYCAH